MHKANALLKHTIFGSILNDISEYEPASLVKIVTQKCWSIFKEGKYVCENESRALTSTASWICFFAIGMDNNNSKKALDESDVSNISNKLFSVLDIFSTHDFQSNEYKTYNNHLVGFIKSWNEFWDDSFNWDAHLRSLYVSESDIDKIIKKTRRIKNNLHKFNLKPLPLYKMYTHIYLTEGLANQNLEIETKYLCIPAYRSLAIYRQLTALLDSDKKIVFEDDIKVFLGCSPLVFHQIFCLILDMAVNYNGVFSYKQLCNVIDSRGNDKSHEELEAN